MYDIKSTISECVRYDDDQNIRIKLLNVLIEFRGWLNSKLRFLCIHQTKQHIETRPKHNENSVDDMVQSFCYIEFLVGNFIAHHIIFKKQFIQKMHGAYFPSN